MTLGPRRFATLTLTVSLCACGARSGLDAPPSAPADAAPDVAPDVAADAPVDRPSDVVRDAPPDLPSPPRPACGNAVVEPGEACDLGPLNSFVPAFAIEQRGVEVPALPVVRRTSIERFYDYRSASAHTGFEIPGATVTMLFVDATTNDLGLLIFTGHDDDSTAPVQPDARWDATLSGVPESSRLAVSDDPGEFTRPSPTQYSGHWNFQQNTDGGAIAGLPWATPWRITITSVPMAGVSAWRLSWQERALRLESAVPATLIHRITPSVCRPDCQRPRCGDGFVDGGERCDDGNTQSGDGCSGDCLRFE